MFGIHEVFNTQQLEVLRNALSADIASNDRLLIGDNEGLYMLDIGEEELYKFSEKDTKRVTQIQVLQKEGVIFLLSGTVPVDCTHICVHQFVGYTYLHQWVVVYLWGVWCLWKDTVH